MRAFNRIDNILEKILEVLITVCLGAVVIITAVQVFFRYVLNQPTTWSQEALMIAFVFTVLFGSALAFKNADHLKVDIFEDIVPGILSKILRVLEFLIVAALLIVLIVYGTILVKNNLTSGQTLSMLPTKQAYVYMILPVSGVFMLYFHVRKVFS